MWFLMKAEACCFATTVLTEEEELPAVSIELSQVDTELMNGGTVSVLMQVRGKLLNLLRGQFCSQLEDKRANRLRVQT